MCKHYQPLCLEPELARSRVYHDLLQLHCPRSDYPSNRAWEDEMHIPSIVAPRSSRLAKVASLGSLVAPTPATSLQMRAWISVCDLNLSASRHALQHLDRSVDSLNMVCAATTPAARDIPPMVKHGSLYSGDMQRNVHQHHNPL
jgi:hypothetical protein